MKWFSVWAEFTGAGWTEDCSAFCRIALYVDTSGRFHRDGRLHEIRNRNGWRSNTREFVEAAALGLTLSATASANPPTSSESYTLTINGKAQEFAFDPRVTLLDLLRERLHLPGTKEGCDHGQCGACTVLVNGVRINSCLTLAISQDGNKITTIEGIANGETLHPLQASFIEHDAFQCGFCTSGQICSGIAMLREWDDGKPSAVSGRDEIAFTDAEIRERMAGNICRCGAYPNIVDAIRAVHDSKG